MAKEELAYTITNRVANSKLKTFNLEDYYPNGERYVLDISQWLLEGLVLQEGKFREQAKNHFNLQSYMLQSAFGALVMGIITSAIVALFVRKK